MADTNQDKLQFLFTVQGLKEDLFTVISMEGYEAISRPYRFTVTLMARKGDDNVMPVETMLSRGATLKIKAVLNDGRVEMMPYQGVLEHFEELQKTPVMAFYRAVLTPRFARTKLDRRSELYTKKQGINLTLTDILKDAIKPPNSENIEFKLGDTYPLRDSVCQYDESTFDFVSRWLEKEGMFYYFDHSGPVEKMVVVDNNIRLPAGEKGVYYRPNAAASFIDPLAVQEFTSRSVPLPQFVTLRDFNHLKAGKSLQETATIPKYAHFNHQDSGEIVIYGEDLRDQDQAQRYAKLRAEEIGCGRTRYFGSSTVVGLRSGYFLGMADVPLSLTMPRDQSNKELKMEFLVTEIQHQGSQAKAVFEGATNPFKDLPGEIFYRNTFTAIHRSVQFRPARTTPKPSISGTMSAIIATGQDTSLDLNEQGMYKLKMPFAQSKDKPDNISTPVRMATPYAGSHHGMDFPLHRDTEVLLSFINGDPDQPVIMNAVPNSENPAIVNNSNPQISQIRTAGGNYVTLDDKKGSQSVRLDAANHRGTLILGSGLGDTLSFSPKTQVAIAGFSDYSFVGPLGGAQVSIGSRVRVGAMEDVDLLQEKLSHAFQGEYKWSSKGAPVKTFRQHENIAIEKAMRTSATESITLEAGHDMKNPEIVANLRLAAAGFTLLEAYMVGIKVLYTMPGVATTLSTLKSARSGIAQVRPELSGLDSGAAPEHFNPEDFNIGDYAALGTTLSTGRIYQFFKKYFSPHAAQACVSQVKITDNGVNLKYKRLLKPEVDLSVTEDGVSQRSLLLDPKAGSKTSVRQYVDTSQGAGMIVSKLDVTGKSVSSNLSLDPLGKIVLHGSKSVDISAEQVNLKIAGAGISLEKDKLAMLADAIELGFMAPSPLGLQFQKSRDKQAELRLQKGTLQQTITDAKAKMQVVPSPPVGTVTAAAAEEFTTAKLAAVKNNTEQEAKIKAAEAELLSVTAQLAAVSNFADMPLPQLMMHGISIKKDEVGVTMGATTIKANATGVAMTMGGSGVSVNLAGMSLTNDKLIKIG